MKANTRLIDLKNNEIDPKTNFARSFFLGEGWAMVEMRAVMTRCGACSKECLWLWAYGRGGRGLLWEVGRLVLVRFFGGGRRVFYGLVLYFGAGRRHF